MLKKPDSRNAVRLFFILLAEKLTLMSKYIFNLFFLLILLASCSDDMPVIDDDNEDPIDTTEIPIDTTEVPIDTTETNILDDYADWMRLLIQENPTKEVTLKNISLPRAHDAGTYVLRSCSFGANACNTQTQDLSMTDMLEAGVRKYDIRPVFVNNKYFTQHVTECGGLGCKGDLIINILEQTKAFLEEHAELVIFEFGHFCYTDADDDGLTGMVDSIMGDRLYTDDGDQSIPFKDRLLENIIPLNSEKGKLMIKYDGVSNNAIDRASGIFAHSYLPTSGSYANSYKFEIMKNDQLQKFNQYSPNSNSIFEISWTQTLNTDLAVNCALNPNANGIIHYATFANSKLDSCMMAWQNDGTITIGKIPNVIGLDFSDKFVTDVCLKITKFNLGI